MLTVPADPAVLRRSLNAIAMHQAGYFTAAQAIKVGYSYQSQKYHVDHGNWDRVDRGLFRLPGWPDRDEDRYVLWRLWSHDLAVVSHQSALVVHDLGDVSPTLLLFVSNGHSQRSNRRHKGSDRRAAGGLRDRRCQWR
jgi:predicted transcriptional regulator of viral defense system